MNLRLLSLARNPRIPYALAMSPKITGLRIFPVGEASGKLAAIGAAEGQQALIPGQAKRRPGYYVHILGSRTARTKAMTEW